MSSADRRLRRLEARAPKGCVTCRYWGPCVYQLGDREPERDERCPECGRLVPILLIRHVVIVPPEDV